MSVESSATETYPVTLSATLSPYLKFKMALKSREVQRQYPNLLERFLDFCRFEGLDVEQKSLEFFRLTKDKSQDEVEDVIVRFVLSQKERIDIQEITAGTLRNYVKAIKLFCRMNLINISWDNIARYLPKVKQYAIYRIPTVEEIRKLIQYPDRRIKLIILLSVSTGIRVGAWDYMKWKHIKPIKDEKNEIVAAKLIVYPDEPEQYFTFMTPEAYGAVKEWMDFRASFGEEITGESWILRNTWQKVKPRYGHRIGLAKYPRQFKSTGIKTLVGRALQIQGIRTKLNSIDGKKNHDWKTLHGFRKFFKTQAERTMKSLNVEILMGHDIGLADSYYRPSEQELLRDYLSSVDLLTIQDDKTKLEKQIKELNEKSIDNEYIIEDRLREKDKQIQSLVKKQEEFEHLIQSLIDSGRFKPNS
jgi:integrase